MTELDIAKLFRERSFRTTPQRIAVYKYLYDNPTHPDADEIYRSVLCSNPSFSKTTVYNSLQALEQEGLIMRVNIDSQRVRYDADVGTHGHFLCTECGKILDLPVPTVECDALEGCRINHQDIYYRGLCPECNKK